MPQAPYRVLLVAEPARRIDISPWKSDWRFALEPLAPSDALARLRRSPADGLAWYAAEPMESLVRSLRAWKRVQPWIQIVVVLAPPPETRLRVALLGAGCYDVVHDRSRRRLRDSAKELHRRIRFVRARQLERLRVTQRMECAGLVGISPQMLRVHEEVQRAADSGVPVLLLGETGTGKGLVARTIHSLGRRRAEPFVTVDCGCLAPSLIESELYGARRGAFTGAGADRLGLAQTAHGGTLFFDEVAELPWEAQSRLLRLLEEGEVRRLGSTQSAPVDVRVISATNRPLERLVEQEHFRMELYHRLDVLAIALPPLRERSEDVPLLAAHFAARHAVRNQPIGLADDTLEILSRYSWPGNVRELKNCIDASATHASGSHIRPCHLPRRISEALAGAARSKPPETLDLKTLERRAIQRALQLTRHDKTQAARLLGIGKTTLYRKLKQMKPELPDSRALPTDPLYLM